MIIGILLFIMIILIIIVIGNMQNKYPKIDLYNFTIFPADSDKPYTLTKVSIPTLIIAGTKGDFETQLVIPIEKMIDMYNKIPSSKVMMRRTNAEHGQMLYSADGYVTSWFMWQLQDNEEASKAFTGDNPEIMQNELYQKRKINFNN